MSRGIVRGRFTYYPHPDEGEEQVLVCTTEGLNKVTAYARTIAEFETWVNNIQLEPRNLLTHRDNTLLAMAEVEWLSMGDRGGWLEDQLQQLEEPRECAHDVSVAGAIKHVVEVRRKYIRQVQEAKDNGKLDELWTWQTRPEIWEQQTCCYTIYGSGGFNRYHVRHNGDVVISGYNSKSAIPGAELLGFEIA